MNRSQQCEKRDAYVVSQAKTEAFLKKLKFLRWTVRFAGAICESTYRC